MLYLRADTVTEVTVGPAVAVGDGFTPVTSLVGSTADEFEIVKHGATATTTIAGTLAAITGADGYYALDLSATDTDTEGRLVVLINDDSLILPIKHEFMVVNANVFDSLFAAAGTDLLQTDLTEIVGVAQSATDLKDFADEGYDPATNKVQGVVLVDTTTTNTDVRGTDSALLAASAPTNFGDLSISVTTGRVDVGSWLGQAVTTSATSLKPEVDINSISDDAPAANNAEAFFDGTGYAGTGNVIPTVTTLTGHTAQTGDSFAIVNSGTFGNAQLVRSTTPANALDVSVAGNAGIDWGNIENATAAVDLSGTDIQLADTVTTLTGHTAQTGDSFAVVNSGTFGNAQLVRATTPANTLDINATGEAGADIVRINNSTTAAVQLQLSADTIVSGTVDTTAFTATTTELEADDITTAAADHYNGRIIIFKSGTLQDQASDLTDYVLTGGRGHFTYTALTSAPANNVIFIIV